MHVFMCVYACMFMCVCVNDCRRAWLCLLMCVGVFVSIACLFAALLFLCLGIDLASVWSVRNNIPCAPSSTARSTYKTPTYYSRYKDHNNASKCFFWWTLDSMSPGRPTQRQSNQLSQEDFESLTLGWQNSYFPDPPSSIKKTKQRNTQSVCSCCLNWLYSIIGLLRSWTLCSSF